MRVPVLLGIAALLVACSDGQEQANNAAAAIPAPEPTPTAIYQGGWSDVFAAGPKGVDAFGRMGFRPGPYERSGDGYRSTGIRSILVDTTAPKPNASMIDIDGGEDRLGRVAFVLELSDPATAETAKQRFAASLEDALRGLGVAGGKEIQQPILTETPAAGTVTGAAWKVERTPLPGAQARKLVVTFTAPAASAPDTRKTQGK